MDSDEPYTQGVKPWTLFSCNTVCRVEIIQSQAEILQEFAFSLARNAMAQTYVRRTSHGLQQL